MTKNIPVHIGIIMDGNRRWAEKRKQTVKEGHQEGVQALERIVKAAAKLGVRFLTVYALSTENIRERGKNEIKNLFSLMKSGFVDKLPILKNESVKVKFFGEIDSLPITVRKIIKSTENKLSDGNRLQLNIALNYGGRAEILNALKNINNAKEMKEIDFSKFLYSKGLPDPELIIRTGGMQRLSNFLLWQAAYSELYFTNTLWPDFNEKDLLKAVKDYQSRKRNFGI